MRAIFLLAAVMFAVSGCLSTELRQATIPASAVIEQPAPNVPAEYAAFSGIWEGSWGSDLDGKLAVQTISGDGNVTGIYAWGDHARGRFSAGNGEFAGKIRNGVLRLNTFSNGANVYYRLRDDDALDGTYTLRGVDTKGVFAKS